MEGHVEEGFEALADELARQVGKGRGGAALCAYHRGRCVVDVWDGVRDGEGRPWQRDTICVSFSTTKGVVATALHMCRDRGVIDYDAPVARYWPEFAQAGKEAITVRDVLVHRAGLFDIRALIADAREMLDWEAMVAKVAAAPAAVVPQGATAYQALTWGWVIGELIRRVSGKSVSAFVRDEIAGPLELDGLYVGVPEEELPRAARLVRPAESGEPDKPKAVARARRRQRRRYAAVQRVLRAFGHPVDFDRGAAAIAPAGISTFDFSTDEVLRACIPAANGAFTARSLARMYQSLARGGELDGVRLVRPETLAQATHVEEALGFDQVTIFRMRWRLGYHRVATLRGVPKRAFGHFGWGGSGAWADPTRQLSMAFVTNVGAGTPIGDLRILRLNTVLLECLRRQRRAG